MSPLAVHVALGLALAESVALAAVLAFRVRGVAGGNQLVQFLFGVGVWIVGYESPSWFGAGAIPLAGWLIAFASLTSVTFLHFTLRFCDANVPARAMAACFALGAATTVVGLMLPPGRFAPWHGFAYFFQPNAFGWVVGVMWALFGLCGHAVLFLSWLGQTPVRRRQLVAVCLASGLGLVSMTGFAFQAWGIDAYPFPLLLLPLYPLILVYGILRYELMVANAWARRALAFTLLAGSGLVLAGALAVVPLPFGATPATWLLRASVVVTAMLLVEPMKWLAGRLIYPGLDITGATLAAWRKQLGQHATYEELADSATEILSAQLRTRISVTVGAAVADMQAGGPLLLCSKTTGWWHTQLRGWEASPPAAFYGAQAFGVVLAEAAGQLEHARALADREREQQMQARLAELGALAATVAHDIRNPLNIISMAAAGTAPELRQEVMVQVKRIAQLAGDLLDYSKSWRFEPRPLDLAEEVRQAAAQYGRVTLGAGLNAPIAVVSDPQRLRQALVNLLDNAVAAYPAACPEGAVSVDADRREDGSVCLHVCDNGEGIPEPIRANLFRPFVSRSPNGTGLGLAIVAKVMQAHGGSVTLSERPGWRTCFTLSFPAEPKP
jgi:signal transduction histidine kinase